MPPARDKSRRYLRRTFPAIALLSLIHMICGLGVGLWFVDRHSYRPWVAILTMCGPVVSSALMGFALLLSFPALLPNGRIGVPANFTMPLVYAVLLRACEILWASPPSAAFRPSDLLMPAAIWAKPLALLALAGTEAVLLTLTARLDRSIPSPG